MFTEFYGFTKNPFGLIADFSFFCLDTPKKEICKWILQDIQHGLDLLVITGALGVGKTQFLRYLNTQLPSDIQCITLTGANVSYSDRLFFIVERLTENERSGKKSLVIIDDAHELPDEDLRLLLSLTTQQHEVPSFQLMVCGLPKLNSTLHRIGFSQVIENDCGCYHLTGLNELQVRDYIYFRLERAGYDKNSEEAIFSRNVIKLITALSHGIPHAINLICGASLLMASLDEKRTVSEQNVREASLSCLLSIENQCVHANSDSEITGSKKASVWHRSLSYRDLIDKYKQAKPLSSRFVYLKHLAKQKNATLARLQDVLPLDCPTQPDKNKVKSGVHNKYQVLVISGMGICFAGILGFLVFKFYFSAEILPANPMNQSLPSQMVSKRALSPNLVTIDTQKTIALTDLNKQQAEPAYKNAGETNRPQDQKPALPLEKLKSTEPKKPSKKALDKSQTEAFKLAGHEEITDKAAVKMNGKEISLASPLKHQEQRKLVFKPAQAINNHMEQKSLDNAVASISGMDNHQRDLGIDEQEASVRERSVNRLRLDKLGMPFNVESLLKAARQGDVQTLKLLLAGGIPPDIKDAIHGFSPLLEAAKYGQFQVVMTLLEKGAFPDIRNHEGQTPLMLAAKKGDRRILKALIDGGARPDVQDLKGWTARSYAEQTHDSEIIALIGGN